MSQISDEGSDERDSKRVKSNHDPVDDNDSVTSNSTLVTLGTDWFQRNYPKLTKEQMKLNKLKTFEVIPNKDNEDDIIKNINDNLDELVQSETETIGTLERYLSAVISRPFTSCLLALNRDHGDLKDKIKTLELSELISLRDILSILVFSKSIISDVKPQYQVEYLTNLFNVTNQYLMKVTEAQPVQNQGAQTGALSDAAEALHEAKVNITPNTQEYNMQEIIIFRNEYKIIVEKLFEFIGNRLYNLEYSELEKLKNCAGSQVLDPLLYERVFPLPAAPAAANSSSNVSGPNPARLNSSSSRGRGGKKSRKNKKGSKKIAKKSKKTTKKQKRSKRKH